MLSGEQLLKQAFSEVAAIKYEQVPEYRHIFSLRYRIRKHKLLRSLERKTAPEPRAHTGRFRLKYLVLTVIMACVLALTGFIFMYFSDGFKGKVYHDNTWLFPTDIEDCPKRLENIYSLPYIPNGFILLAEDETDYIHYSFYKNETTGQSITFCQYIKSVFNVHANTEGFELVETKINGCNAVYIDYSPKWNCADVI